MSRKRQGTTLDLWPPLPIYIHYNLSFLFLEDKNDVIAALTHPDRIFEIDLTISNWLLEKSNAWVESFPILERLSLFSSDRSYPVLPSAFLGGSALASRRLRYIELERVYVPTLPQLLLSSQNLIRLFLGKGVIADEGFLSPAVLTAVLSAVARLESLHVYLPSNIFHEQGSTDSVLPLPKFVVLPALIHLELLLRGSDDYLEDLVSRIHAPLLETICVKASEEYARPMDIPQLSKFIRPTDRLSLLPIQTSIILEESRFKVSHEFGIRGHICFELTCDSGSEFLEVSQVVHVVHVFKQLFPPISDVERVVIEINIPPHNPIIPPAEMEIDRWLQLFPLFDGAQELELCSGYTLLKLHESPNSKIGQELFPALRILRLTCGFDVRVPRIIKSFVAERELTGRPITMIRTCRRLRR